MGQREISKSHQRIYCPRDFSRKVQKSEGVRPSSTAGTTYMALSWTIAVPLELGFLKLRFLWRCRVGGSIVRKWPHVSGLTT